MMIDDYVKKSPGKAICFTSMGQLRYLSALKYVDAVVGNSSSGLAEAPTFKIGTINIGDRQKGRIKAESVIDCKPEKTDILRAFNILYDEKFISKLKQLINPYGNGGASQKIVALLREVRLDDLIKKEFYNIKFNL